MNPKVPLSTDEELNLHGPRNPHTRPFFERSSFEKTNERLKRAGSPPIRLNADAFTESEKTTAETTRFRNLPAWIVPVGIVFVATAVTVHFITGG